MALDVSVFSLMFFLLSRQLVLGSVAQDASRVMSLPPRTIGLLDSPTQVFVTVSVNSLGELNPTDGTFSIDAYLYYAWQDDRYNSTEDGAVFFPSSPTDGWDNFNPQIEIINAFRGSASSLPSQYYKQTGIPSWIPRPSPYLTDTVGQDIWISASARVAVLLTATYQLQCFPFDSETVGIDLESVQWTSSDVVIRETPSTSPGMYPPGPQTGLSSSIPGWDAKRAYTTLTVIPYETLDQSYARISVYLDLKRQSAYYESRFVQNVVMLVIIAIFALFINGNETARFIVTQGSFLGVVSWEFIVVSSLPPLPYTTALDRFMNVSFGVIFAIYVYAGIRFGWHKTLTLHTRHAEGQAATLVTGVVHRGWNFERDKAPLVLTPSMRHDISLQSGTDRSSAVVFPTGISSRHRSRGAANLNDAASGSTLRGTHSTRDSGIPAMTESAAVSNDNGGNGATPASPGTPTRGPSSENDNTTHPSNLDQSVRCDRCSVRRLLIAFCHTYNRHRQLDAVFGVFISILYASASLGYLYACAANS